MTSADRQRRYRTRQKEKLETTEDFEHDMAKVAQLAEDIIACNRLGLRGSVADHAHALLELASRYAGPAADRVLDRRTFFCFRYLLIAFASGGPLSGAVFFSAPIVRFTIPDGAQRRARNKLRSRETG